MGIDILLRRGMVGSLLLKVDHTMALPGCKVPGVSHRQVAGLQGTHFPRQSAFHLLLRLGDITKQLTGD